MIYHKPLFREILALSIVILFIHYFASVYSLYWTIEWLDMLLHFLGGFLIGSIALLIFFTSGKINLPTDNKALIFIVCLGLVLIVGLAWELFEIFIGLTDIFADKLDTISDLIMDTLGAITTYYYSLNKIWTKK